MGKRKTKRKNRFKKIFRFIIILGILILFLKYLFDIKTKNIVILNNNYYTDDDIIYNAGLNDYPKFILLNKSSIKKKLKKLKLIEDVTIKKKLGYVLEINITEKKILYYVRSDDKYILSDGSEYEQDYVYGIPTLINFVPDDIEKSFIEEFKNIDSSIISLISEIEYSKTDYDDKRFLLYMNDGNLVYININKLKNLNKYQEIIKNVGDKKGILYLDSGNYFEIKSK